MTCHMTRKVSTHRKEDDPCQPDQRRSRSPPTRPAIPALHPQLGLVDQEAVSSSVEICKEICLITVGLTEANVATVLAGWLSK